MSRFLNQQYLSLDPYVPGEQPQNRQYIKLNTNENPYPPSEYVLRAINSESKRLNLYPDPECGVFLKKLSEYFGVDQNQVFAGNGSDEVLAFLFQAVCEKGVAFSDITYGFYRVYAKLYGITTKIIPLQEDLSLNPLDYHNLLTTIVIANPNAPTGKAISKVDIATIIEANPENLVIIDEAYVEFGAESVVDLVSEYDNLVVVGTFSKSRSLAGARLGYALADSAVIDDLNRIKFSVNPYNVNRMTLAAAVASLEDNESFLNYTGSVVKNREYTVDELTRLGFSHTNSKANFIFVKHRKIKGQQLYQTLKDRGILVRWLNQPRIEEYVRISIGSRQDMQKLVEEIEDILKEAL